MQAPRGLEQGNAIAGPQLGPQALQNAGIAPDAFEVQVANVTAAGGGGCATARNRRGTRGHKSVYSRAHKMVAATPHTKLMAATRRQGLWKTG